MVHVVISVGLLLIGQFSIGQAAVTKTPATPKCNLYIYGHIIVGYAMEGSAHSLQECIKVSFQTVLLRTLGDQIDLHLSDEMV